MDYPAEALVTFFIALIVFGFVAWLIYKVTAYRERRITSPVYGLRADGTEITPLNMTEEERIRLGVSEYELEVLKDEPVMFHRLDENGITLEPDPLEKSAETESDQVQFLERASNDYEQEFLDRVRKALNGCAEQDDKLKESLDQWPHPEYDHEAPKDPRTLEELIADDDLDADLDEIYGEGKDRLDCTDPTLEFDYYGDREDDKETLRQVRAGADDGRSSLETRHNQRDPEDKKGE